MHLLGKWLLTALAFLAAAYAIPGISVSGIYIALILAAIWGLFSITIRPVLFILTLPINILTFGLFTFVINGVLLWLLGTFIQGFHVDGFLPAILGGLVITAVTWLGDRFLKKATL